ncbi:MAG: sensor histidine kinase, partial [Streptosporangiaceae bacterium]
VLAAALCAFAVQNVNDAFISLSAAVNVHFGLAAIAWLAADTATVVALQLRHSWPARAGSGPRAWPVTLVLQAVLTYALFPILAWRSLVMCGFLAGSVLLLVPGRRAGIAFAAVVASVPALWPLARLSGLTPLERASAVVFLTAFAAMLGLMVYGLSWLARLALQLEALRDELARMAVATERLRVVRDTHDLLGLGLSAIALKTDLITRLLGHDNDRARAEIGEMARICAAARTDIRLVTGEARHPSLDTELAAAGELLASAGIEVRTDVSAVPPPAAAAVLVPVLREAVTNILRHSGAGRCAIETVTAAGVLQLRICNDGVASDMSGRAGHGLANLAARVEAAGGRLTSHGTDSEFSLVAEIPVSVTSSMPT